MLAALVAGVLAAPVLADTTPEKPAPDSGKGAPEKAPAPAPAPAPADTRDREVQELKALIQQLQKRVEDLEKKPEPAPEPVVPPMPDPNPAVQPTPTGQGVPTGGGGGATFIPNISVVGNLIARAGDTKATPGRGRSHFEELEIAFQDQVAPKLRYDAFFSAEKEESWSVGMEEGYLTATGVLPGLNLRAGRINTPIGKFNPLHPHQWLFITRPSAATALLGEHGLSSDGIVATYVLPTKGLYAGFDFGVWENASEIHGHEEEEEEEEEEEGEESPAHERAEGSGFRGGQKGAYSTRLHLSKGLSLTKELELGFTRSWGRGDVEGFGRKMLAINGVDLTYRSFPGAFSRVWVSAEMLAHETAAIGGDTKYRLGGWLTAAYRWNQYWEAGIRADYTQYPFPISGHEVGGSVFLTKYVTEQTSLRLEYRHAKDPDFGHTNAIFFQLLFGSGPHSHPLQ
jgi:hypothetical protein